MDYIKGGYYLKARRIQESEIAHAAPVIREVWDWLIKEANSQDNERVGISRGQLVRQIKDVQEGLHWFIGFRKESYTKGQCETALNWLRDRKMILTEKTTRGLIITIIKYGIYQNPASYEISMKLPMKGVTKLPMKRTDDNSSNPLQQSVSGMSENHEANSEGITNRTRTEQHDDTINNNDKNLKNDNKRETRAKIFYDDLIPFVGQYPKEMVRAFYDYWTEGNKSGTKMKFELQQTFEISKRLVTWASRDKEFSGKNKDDQQKAKENQIMKDIGL